MHHPRRILLGRVLAPTMKTAQKCSRLSGTVHGILRSGVRRFGGHVINSRKAMIEMQHAQEAQRRAQTSMARASTTNGGVGSIWIEFGQEKVSREQVPTWKITEAAGLRACLGGQAPGQRAALFGSDAGGPGPRFNTSLRRSISSVRRRAHSRARLRWIWKLASLLPKIDLPFLALAPMTQGVRWRSVHTT